MSQGVARSPEEVASEPREAAREQNQRGASMKKERPQPAPLLPHLISSAAAHAAQVSPTTARYAALPCRLEW